MLADKVKDTVKRYCLISPKDRIVVGVSGGPDSVALLHILNSLRYELKIGLHIAHLDHMLRKDSGKDREFVEALAAKMKLPLTVARINVAALAGKGSPEEIARNARLGFFFRVAREIKAHKIALAHNFDDQAETVLMRILRGSGLYGLSGILPKRDIAGFIIIRPLIETRRSDIES
ncbi:tRNA lysidine(34) synthetase TilS, partial [Patescibacteria group bacterium]|nr:tRNA lysidine(34) synthetase TilS [Patescibacteria group bacterium]